MSVVRCPDADEAQCSAVQCGTADSRKDPHRVPSLPFHLHAVAIAAAEESCGLSALSESLTHSALIGLDGNQPLSQRSSGSKQHIEKDLWLFSFIPFHLSDPEICRF